MKTREEQIEEMARAICATGVALDGTDYAFGVYSDDDHFHKMASALYDANIGDVTEWKERAEKHRVIALPGGRIKQLYSDEEVEQIAKERDELNRAGKFPCKVGDTIYQTDTNGTRIFKSTVKNIIFETDGVAFDERAIGESIFLTEEAVNEKMKELNGGER